MRLWLINAVFSLLIGSIGAIIGWWLRARIEKSGVNQHKKMVKKAMDELQDCTSSLRTRVAAHSNDVSKVASALQAQEADGDSVANSAVEAIVKASDRIRTQLTEIELKLQTESTIIERAISEENPEMLFMKSMNRKKRLYRKVLCSLEMLANDLASDVEEHRSRVGEIGESLEDQENRNSADVIEAVNKIVDVTSNMQNQISRVEQRLEAQTAQVEKHITLAGRDDLTGLPNRRVFDKELRRLHNEFQSHTKPYSVIFLDVDHFKKINDQHGHQVGDNVLCELGKTLLNQIREDDIAARYGGEEFAILLPFTSELDARLVAERIRKACAAKEFKCDKKRLRMTISAGVSSVAPNLTTDVIIERADLALYAAKEAGRNLTFWHDGINCIPFGQSAPEPFKLVAEVKDIPNNSVGDTGDRRNPSAGEIDPSTFIPPEYELSNRSIFCVNVNRRITEWQRGGAPISLLLMRIDQADAIAQEHGQLAAAQLKAALCRLLKAFSRDMDDRCEFDSNTYAILVPNSDSSNISKIGERLRNGVAESQMQFGKKQWKLTASVGVAHTDSGDSGMELMRRGEEAVNKSSNKGGNVTYLADRVGISRVTKVVAAN